jgi:hypothetical protein
VRYLLIALLLSSCGYARSKYTAETARAKCVQSCNEWGYGDYAGHFFMPETAALVCSCSTPVEYQSR